MSEEQKDKGLKKTLQEQYSFQLPSNFTYCTMHKVEENMRLREKKTEYRTLLATIIATIFLIGVCIASLIIFFGNSIREAFTISSITKSEEIQIPSFYFLLIIAVLLCLLFDRWMRKQYYKHHP